jgi:transposase
MVAIENQLKRWFSVYFPEHKMVFGDWACAGSLIVLKNAPLPQDVLKLETTGINALWREQKLRAVGIGRAVRLYEAAKSSVGVTEGVNAARCELQMLLDDYLVKQKQLEIVMMILETLVIQIPHAEKLLAIKGIGILTVAGFFAEVGDLSRFKSPKQIQKLAGLAITENSSGKYKGQTRISKRGRKLLRYTLFQAVTSLIRHQSGFAVLHKYYKTRRNNPLKGKQSKVALCNKLIRIFWVITTKGKDFDSYKMMSDITRVEPIAA